MTAIHILWVNLITDSLPAISLGVDPDDPDVMKKKPRPANESIFGGGAGSFVVFNDISRSGNIDLCLPLFPDWQYRQARCLFFPSTSAMFPGKRSFMRKHSLS